MAQSTAITLAVDARIAKHLGGSICKSTGIGIGKMNQILNNQRGFFAIGIICGKTPQNIGTLWRSAHAFDADYIFTVGARHPLATRFLQMDVSKASLHVPKFNYADIDSFVTSIPEHSELIGIECNRHLPRPARSLPGFVHPERAVYLLGAEDHGLPKAILPYCNGFIYIPTAFSLNVAVSGSIVLYDRISKMGRPIDYMAHITETYESRC